ncbi:MAG: hypothetical protein M0Z45_00835 [Actinomycetota bacterium]|nr:hypothetical protein [Actinomycetota bacterium]
MNDLPLLLISLGLSLFAVAIALVPQFTTSNGGQSKRSKSILASFIPKIPKGLGPSELGGSVALSLLAALIPSIILASPIPLLVAPLVLVKATAAIDRAKLERLRKVAASEWPNVLSELHLRITAMGSPMHHGLFSAAKSAKETLHSAFEHSERTFAITNSFELALDTLYNDLPFTTTFRVVEALKVVLEVPGGDIAGIILDLKDDLEREWRQQSEFEARLKGVKFARNFVVIVPVAMFLAGASIGGFGSYRGVASIITLSMSSVVVFTCWVIVSKMTSSDALYKGEVDLIRSAWRKRVER